MLYTANNTNNNYAIRLWSRTNLKLIVKTEFFLITAFATVIIQRRYIEIKRQNNTSDTKYLKDDLLINLNSGNSDHAMLQSSPTQP